MPLTPDRRSLMQLTLLGAAPSLLSLGAARANDAASDHEGLRDFDFLVGSWRVRHKRLKERLANNNEWEEFNGTCAMQKLLGGYGNVDDNFIHLPGGAYRGVGLRSFDPETRTWAIWWLDSRAPHKLDVPVVGGFKDGVGVFLADDTLRGKPIKMRFQWSDITESSCKWEQAFSPDGGETWETNWVMHFTRTA